MPSEITFQMLIDMPSFEIIKITFILEADPWNKKNKLCQPNIPLAGARSRTSSLTKKKTVPFTTTFFFFSPILFATNLGHVSTKIFQQQLGVGPKLKFTMLWSL